jgi:hypothetical protein
LQQRERGSRNISLLDTYLTATFARQSSMAGDIDANSANKAGQEIVHVE